MKLKIRGMNADGSGFVYGTGVTDFLNMWPEQKGKTWLWSDYSWVEVEPETIGQLTVKKDEDGKDLFEGDLIVNMYGDTMLIEWSDEYSGFQYTFFEDGVRLDTSEGPEDHPDVMKIGNIHEL